ncbi:MAG: hypothetical protein HZA91_01765 [Verrucomicrobia bacterium]|nr:hypothetical protein [Verrucomicrobiota bacterium]
MKQADMILPALLGAAVALVPLASEARAAEAFTQLASINAADLLTPEQLTEQEIVRRKEQLIRGQTMLRNADAALKAGKFDEAISLYQQAITTLPKSPATVKDVNAAASGLIQANLGGARAALKAKNAGDAEKYANAALVLDPKNATAKSIRDQAGKISGVPQARAGETPKPVKPMPVDATPEYRQKMSRVTQLMRDAHLAFQSNQLDLASDKLNEVMSLDHYNQEARTLLRLVNEQRHHAAELDRARTREQFAADVTEAWAPPIRAALSAPMEEQKPTQIIKKERQELERKLDTIIIPKIDFRDANVMDVVKFLSDESRRLDKEKGGGDGVNIVLGGSLAGAGGGGSTTPQAPPGAEMPGAPTPAPGPAMPGAPGAVPGIPGAPGAPVPAPVPGAEMPGAGPAPGMAGPAAAPAGPSGTPTVTLNLQNVPLRDALRYVTDIAGLRFRVEERAILIVPANWVPPGIMQTRNYKIQAGVFSTILTGQQQQGGQPGGAPAPPGAGPAPAPPVGSGGGGPSGEEVKKFFMDAGVPFPQGASVTYQDRINTLFVTNTPENLETFEMVLNSLNIVPSQVTIEAKFVEIKQGDLRELGFDWILGDWQFGHAGNGVKMFNLEGGDNAAFAGIPNNSNPGGNIPVYQPGDLGNTTDRAQGLRFASSSGTLTGNALDNLLQGRSQQQNLVLDSVASLSGLLTNPQFQVILRALSQRQNVDLLSAPKVTTISGQQAKMEVIREFIYPTEFEPPRVANGASVGAGGFLISAVTPPTPGGFQTRSLGVTLNVTPQVGPDGYTINLTLIPEVSDFDGFVDYGSRSGLNDPSAAGSAASQQVGLAFPFPQPVFSTRRVTTSVIIWDGQTVVLGGLIREDAMKIKDKIPFLGDIPMVGKLFRNELENTVKRNLLIFVTAKLINTAGELIHKTAAAGPLPAPAGGSPVAR